MDSLDKMLRNLSLDGCFKNLLEKHWAESTIVASDEPDFLSSEFIDHNLPITGNTEADVADRLKSTAKKIRNSADLTRLARHTRYVLCNSLEKPEIKSWPELDQQLGEDCGVFYLLIAISLIPEIFKAFNKFRLPEKYAAACCKWINGTIQVYRAAHNGTPGHNRAQLFWLRHYITGKLFRIGRFEYMNQTFPKAFPVVVYKNQHNGSIAALAKDQVRFDAEGYILPVEKSDSEAAFISCLKITEKHIIGTPVSPRGMALDQQIKLVADEWTQILGPNSFTPGIHIPGGGKMSREACKESFLEAIEFYKKYFPEKKVDAFVCSSWIFWPEYEKAMPHSNLAQFMRELYLFPFPPGKGKDGLFFIFGREDGNPTEYPRDNSVRRAMLDLYDERQFLRCGSMFILPEHLEHYGTQYYRNNCPEFVK
jgi:GNAT-like C-terminal domain